MKTCCIEDCSLPTFAKNRYCKYHAEKQRLYSSRGIPASKFEELMAVTNCEVCNAPLGDNGKGRSRALDHDHSHCGPKKWCSQCIRGVVCIRCNQFLAALDSPGWLKQGQRYLELHKAGDR